MGGSGFKKISKASSVWLERPPSMEKVKQGVWADGLKATSQDGYTFSFYKKRNEILLALICFLWSKNFFELTGCPRVLVLSL
jgi:hypothetical protein